MFEDIKEAANKMGINFERLESLIKELEEFHAEIEKTADKKIESEEEYQERLKILEKLERLGNELDEEKDKVFEQIEKEKKKIKSFYNNKIINTKNI